MNRKYQAELKLDRDFLQYLQDLKLNMIDCVWINRQKKLILKDLRKRKLPAPMLKSADPQQKLLKAFFVDLIEKIVKPCKQLHWERSELELTFSSIVGTFAECELTHSSQPRVTLKELCTCGMWILSRAVF